MGEPPPSALLTRVTVGRMPWAWRALAASLTRSCRESWRAWNEGGEGWDEGVGTLVASVDGFGRGVMFDSNNNIKLLLLFW